MSEATQKRSFTLGPDKPSSFSTDASTENGMITVFLYDDVDKPRQLRPFVIQEHGKVFGAEEICQRVAKDLHLSTLATNLFALVTPDMSIWLPPDYEIMCHASYPVKYIFRMRFIPPREKLKSFSRVDANAFSYLYFQCQHDFLNDSELLRYNGEEIGQRHLLGLGVIDIIRYGKDKSMELDQLWNLKPKDFIPRKCARFFTNILERKRLKDNFRKHLGDLHEKYKDETSARVKSRFVLGLLDYARQYGVEMFQTTTGETMVVDPSNDTMPGIYSTVSKKDKAPVHFAAIEDLMDVSVRSTKVMVSQREGTPKEVGFDSEAKALSFASLLCGYHRMMCDFHTSICQQIQSPSQMWLKKMRSHGPVRPDWASNRLMQAFLSEPHFNFLLKQRRDDLDSLVLFYVPSPSAKQPDVYPINKLPNHKYQILLRDEQEFASITDLLTYYRSGTHDEIKLNRCVAPRDPVDEQLYLCKKESEAEPQQTHREDERVTLVQSAHILPMEKLGQGHFTEVSMAHWNAGSILAVACKVLKDSTKLADFQQAIQRASFWCHPSIVRVHAVCLAVPFSVLMEHAEMGSLPAYMAHPQSNITNTHLLNAAEQIAQALLYLEEKDTGQSLREQVHGNIRARNILLFQHDQSQFRVKLGDPGMVDVYNKLPLRHDLNLERLPWLAPETYSQLQLTTFHSDHYAFGVLLWELFSRCKRPFGTLPPEKILESVLANQQLPPPENCPTNIRQLMENCLQSVPEKRPTAKEMIYTIRQSTLETDDDHNYNNLAWKASERKSGVQETSGASTSTGASNSALSTGTRAAIVDNELNSTIRQLLSETSVPAASYSNTGMVNGVLHRGMVNGVLQSPTSPTSLSPGIPSPCDSRTPLLPASVLPSLLPPRTSSGSGTSVETTTTDVPDDLGSPTFERETAVRPAAIQAMSLPPLPAIDPCHQIERSDLDIDFKHEIGAGHYGAVYKGVYKEVQEVAIKKLLPEMYNKYAAEFDREFHMMVKVKHEFIVQVIGSCPQKDEDNPMLLVMEYISRGSLKGYLKMKKDLAPLKLLQFSIEIAKGMAYLSLQNIVHRDLATRNILVTEDEHMRISDFGLSRALADENDYYKSDKTKEIPAWWCAPEGLLNRKFTRKGDVWSYGVTLWEIYNKGKDPNFGDLKNLPLELHRGKRLPARMCPEDVYTIIRQGCWTYYPEERKEFREILEELEKLMERMTPL